MTNSLVDRLREPNRKQLPDWPEDLLTDAADEIERLRGKLTEISERSCDSNEMYHNCPLMESTTDIALDALNPETPE